MKPISPPINTSILVSRTDAIGDVILTIPLTYVLKKYFPQNKIIFLGTSYTKPILQYISTIDEIIDYTNFSSYSLQKQKEFIQTQNIHTAILVYPTYDLAKMLFQLKIPYRIATSHRWYNWLYANKLVSFSRKNSNLHEAQLNFYLLKPFDINQIPSLSDLTNMYSIKPIPSLHRNLLAHLDSSKFKVILHPKSRGSAREWSIENYIHLIKILDPSKFQIIITGTQNELSVLNKIFDECPFVLNLAGKTTLDELIALIYQCDALVAASTGTLHISAILGKHTIGIFPPIRPMHPGRWAPLGKNIHIFCSHKKCTNCKNTPYQCACIQEISPLQIAELLNSLYLHKYKQK